MNKPKVLGIIPARGNSKRLPRKNIKELLGKPLIAYTIEAASKAESLTDFLVTSEDAEILEVARQWGAPTPFVRPKELSGDEVRNIETVNHAFQFMEANKGTRYDILVLLQPTCPIRDPAHIDKSVYDLWESNLDSAVSIKGPYKKRDPILKALREGIVEDFFDRSIQTPVEAFYLYNASIYSVKRDYFKKQKKLISPKQIPVLMDQYHSIDIDTYADFLVAEAYLKYLNN